MLNSPFDVFALLIAVVALIFARKAFNQASTLRARLDAIEAAAATPQPLQPTAPIGPSWATAGPGGPAEQPATVADALPTAPPEQEGFAPDGAASVGAAATPPSPTQPEPGFEERIGTRWVVWIGGLTL